MSYRELSVTEVHELLARWQAGASIKSTSRVTGIDRKTIRRYAAVACAVAVGCNDVLTDEVVRAVAGVIHARPPPPLSDARQRLLPHAARIAAWRASGVPLT